MERAACIFPTREIIALEKSTPYRELSPRLLETEPQISAGDGRQCHQCLFV